jgi:hypothetical protein
VLSDSSGITGVRVADGSVLSSNLYIDCSGFKRLLASELDNEWVDFDQYYNDTALVTAIPYDDNDHPLHSFRPVTVLAGMNSGWRFGVTSRSRTGNGYVFNSRQVTDIDKISSEFRNCLGIDSNKPLKMLKWKPGYFKNIWHKNCVTLGLSMGFGDPFDANNLGLTTAVLKRLITDLNSETSEDRTQFNQRFEKIWKEIDLRVQTTLRLSPRRDTEHYRLMDRVAEETDLKQRWFDHIISRRDNYFTERDQYIFPLRTHIAVAIRYGIELPMLDADAKYFDAVNSYFDYMNDFGLHASKNAPGSKEYYASRKR